MPLLTMDRNTPYNFWQEDSQLYLHVKAANAERLQKTTDHSISQPHQHFLHFVLENSPGDSTPVVSQYHVVCDGDSTIGSQTVGPPSCDDVLDAGIAQGDIQSDTAGQHLHRASSSYSPYDYLPAHNMGHSDTNLVKSCSHMQESQHDPRHQLQEEVDPHPRYVVNDDESKSHAGCASVCQWNDGYGACGRIVNAAKIGEHMSSYHFKSPLRADKRLKCLWKDCELHKLVRRDTIIRHIVEKHLGLKYRCKLWAASPAGAGFCRSRKNTRLHEC
ncbi:uncharacterized protein EDB93DRAFT_770265 [Suillus bovinus]|uniref:uncharacterized protein n=1 Tax=Suillus bovinus TaxID=48563 RepID=UPI001B873507|nr:uncharacterized protein EDB93DRAFT_153321 [Suillus bovinus]XP_041304164.1 uncharacterized protein EDB93DRAFT_770265 [Suillus bovinus]KAG2128665.1 hypothetical protein EDB93DRAFT_153321 [Suillus bovinus]KAG2136917.1 hypothetical protein EDB93DRAFT_770265 [Suillus bovinus]